MPSRPDLSKLLSGPGAPAGMQLGMPLAVPMGGFLKMSNWKTVNGDILATKEWEMSNKDAGGTEKGQFILFHKPGK